MHVRTISQPQTKIEISPRQQPLHSTDCFWRLHVFYDGNWVALQTICANEPSAALMRCAARTLRIVANIRTRTVGRLANTECRTTGRHTCNITNTIGTRNAVMKSNLIVVRHFTWFRFMCGPSPKLLTKKNPDGNSAARRYANANTMFNLSHKYRHPKHYYFYYLFSAHSPFAVSSPSCCWLIHFDIDGESLGQFMRSLAGRWRKLATKLYCSNRFITDIRPKNNQFRYSLVFGSTPGHLCKHVVGNFQDYSRFDMNR